MSKILITGGAGFLGSHLADYLHNLGHDVVVVDDFSGGYKENLDTNKLSYYDVSVTHAADIDAIFSCERPEYAYHLAAYAAEGLSHFIRLHNYENNVLGSMSVINACVRHKVKGLIFTSSMAVYGSSQVPMTEEMTPQPEDPYGIAKYAVELDLAAAHRQFGLNYLIFRPHNVYGPRQNMRDPYRNVVAIFMNQALRGEPLTIFGDGSQRRAFSYIADVLPYFARVLNSPLSLWNQAYNVGADEVYAVSELAEMISNAFGGCSIDYLPPRKEVQEAYCNHRKARRAFGIAPQTSLGNGLTKMAAWARDRGPQQPAPFPGTIELPEYLPEAWREKCTSR